MAFEQLVAEAALKKEQDKADKKKRGKDKDKHKSQAAQTAADAPNVPKA